VDATYRDCTGAVADEEAVAWGLVGSSSESHCADEDSCRSFGKSTVWSLVGSNQRSRLQKDSVAVDCMVTADFRAQACWYGADALRRHCRAL
jgi:hypothetical protein